VCTSCSDLGIEGWRQRFKTELIYKHEALMSSLWEDTEWMKMLQDMGMDDLPVDQAVELAVDQVIFVCVLCVEGGGGGERGQCKRG